jgi:hypothetical protein
MVDGLCAQALAFLWRRRDGVYRCMCDMQVGEMRMGKGVYHIGMEKPQRLETGVFFSKRISGNMHKGFGFLEYGCGVWVTRWSSLLVAFLSVHGSIGRFIVCVRS